MRQVAPGEPSINPETEQLEAAARRAVLLTDDEGTILAAGGELEPIFGRGSALLVGAAIATLFHGSGGPIVLHSDENTRSWQDVRVAPPGPQNPLSVTMIRTSGGEEPNTVVLVSTAAAATLDEARDINTTLRTSNQQLESFASVAAHDLQEPLRKIRAFSDRVRTLLGRGTSEQVLDYLDRIDAAAARMQTLITDLLALARLTGRPPEKALISLNDVLTLVRHDLSDEIDSLGARIEVADLPDVVADPSQMRQLFSNLIANSLKYHEEGIAPRIRVTSVASGERVTIAVEDNGIGFDDRYLTKIFAPFERLHGRDEYQGTGVGLALCRTIVERHGGTITAHGQPGVGSEFTINLPVSSP